MSEPEEDEAAVPSDLTPQGT